MPQAESGDAGHESSLGVVWCYLTPWNPPLAKGDLGDSGEGMKRRDLDSLRDPFLDSRLRGNDRTGAQQDAAGSPRVSLGPTSLLPQDWGLRGLKARFCRQLRLSDGGFRLRYNPPYIWRGNDNGNLRTRG